MFSLKSYAKLNLALCITHKRSDGFHELKTIFERINLYDTLKFSLRKDHKIYITTNHPDVPVDESNLVYKAAILLRQHSKCSLGANIHIQKRIPVAAGLAGGSSNGATALMGLNRLWKTNVSQKTLQQLAAQLGSDLNFFLSNVSFALGEGRGEKIKPMMSSLRFWHVIVTPRIPILAKQAYEAFSQQTSAVALKKRVRSINNRIKEMLLGIQQTKEVDVIKNLTNDLEKAILMISPELDLLKEKLLQQKNKGVCFSGSGPSIFAIVETKKEADCLAEQLQKTYQQVFVVRTI